MKFNHDAFISYAHIDNVPLDKDQGGWVTRFRNTLEALLSQRFGRDVNIWLDYKLSGSDAFREEVIGHFSETAVMISILTPRYVNSEWCMQEASEFCRAAEQTGGVVVHNRSRLIKVIKTPVRDDSALPDAMKRAVGYQFYIFDKQETPQELDPAYGEEFKKEYYVKMNQLAFDVAQLIEKLGPEAVSLPQESVASVKQLFVSYAREDKTFVVDLATKLKIAGISVWLDQWDITEGDDWDRRIDDALYGLPGFLIVISPASVESKEVRSELRVALDMGKQIFPVMYQKVDRFPRELRLSQWVDLTTEVQHHETAIQGLIRSLKAKLH